jgi:hypothetical protein
MESSKHLIIHRHTFRERRYAMKKHDATALHYDLRMEWNGIALDWAVPEGPDRIPRKSGEP